MAGMAPVVSRRLADLANWFDDEFRTTDAHLIRLEDHVTDNEYSLCAELPGVDPAKDVQITVDRGFLAIHAERRQHEEAHGRSEFHYGSMDRAVRLPDNADIEHVTARYDNGLLKVSVPLTAPESTVRKITIATSAGSPETDSAGGGASS